jgi:hypothetical protein
VTWRNLEKIYDVSDSLGRVPDRPGFSVVRVRLRKEPIFATIAPRSPRWEHVRAKIPRYLQYKFTFIRARMVPLHWEIDIRDNRNLRTDSFFHSRRPARSRAL